jgi:hypothetical protein
MPFVSKTPQSPLSLPYNVPELHLTHPSRSSQSTTISSQSTDQPHADSEYHSLLHEEPADTAKVSVKARGKRKEK